ncbi:MAG: GntP family permease [Clostridia bacterium]|nr:GntP family permease [Clostridia bacterium]
MELALIFLSLFCFMYLAYRGYSIVLFAPLFAIIASLGSGFGIMPVYSEIYMTKAAEFIKTYFPVFLFGAVFAKMMEESGLAASIASAVIRWFGREKTIPAVLICCGILCYGGVSVFIVMFVMYPFMAILYREADIPKRLIPVTFWAGCFSYSMTALPGVPQIQNIQPTAYLGTTTWAAPLIGLFASVCYFLIGWGWITYRYKKLSGRGEGYGQHSINEPSRLDEARLAPWTTAIIPLFVVILINLLISNPFDWSWGYQWNPDSLKPLDALNLSLLNPSVERVSAIWSLTIALFAGILCTWLVGRRQLAETTLLKPLNTGALSSISAILNIASGYAFGSVITNLPAFQAIKNGLLNLGSLSGNPLLSGIITTNIMTVFSGGSSAGITIALDMLGKEWIALAQAAGISPEVLHRIVCLASTGPDTVPHSGGMITIMLLCGLTHKESYFDLFVLLLLNTSVAYLAMGFYYLTGLV